MQVSEEKDERQLDEQHSTDPILQREIAENGPETEIGEEALKIIEVKDGNIPMGIAMECEESSVVTADTILAVEECTNESILTEDEDEDEKMPEQVSVSSVSCYQSKV